MLNSNKTDITFAARYDPHMRSFIPTVVVAAFIAGTLAGSRFERLPTALAAVPAPTVSIKPYFSPKGGCSAAIVAEIDAARQTLDIQAYSFTSTPIAKAVREAFERGVKVRVILDKSQRTEQYSSATYLLNATVPVWIDAKHAIAHNKVLLIDGKVLITGSFNLTASAENSNAENILVIKSAPELTASYAANFLDHLQHAEKYEGPGR